MRKISGITAALLFCLGIGACGPPRPLTVQAQEATNVSPFFPGPDNPAWSDYYVMCMRSLGIGNVAISRLWP